MPPPQVCMTLGGDDIIINQKLSLSAERQNHDRAIWWHLGTL